MNEGCDRGADHLDKVLGIANGMIWICTDWGRLIALNVETGELMYQFIPADVAEDKIVLMYSCIILYYSVNLIISLNLECCDNLPLEQLAFSFSHLSIFILFHSSLFV